MDLNERRPLLITCPPGLADYLAVELETLGYPILERHSGGIVSKGSLTDCMKLNLQLRTAYHVLYLLRQFRCGSPDKLYRQVSNLPWEKILSPDTYLCVLSRVDTWSINNSMFPNLKVKDAIVDRLLRKTGRRPDSGPDRHKTVINLFWNKDDAWLYLNTSGQKLSDRNYRKMPHKAPLRENLAAALLMAAGYDGSQDLVLPMCGSGTLAIEAAFIAGHKLPGLLRSNFGFMHILPFDPERYQALRSELRQATHPGQPARQIIATDIDPQAIGAARQNARTAGVEQYIQFEVCDFTRTPIPDGAGNIILLNPEYGHRLGDTERLKQQYRAIGDFFKQRCAGYTGYVFTGNPQLARQVGLKPSGKLIFFNGKIECRLIRYELYRGSRPRTVDAT